MSTKAVYDIVMAINEHDKSKNYSLMTENHNFIKFVKTTC